MKFHAARIAAVAVATLVVVAASTASAQDVFSVPSYSPVVTEVVQPVTVFRPAPVTTFVAPAPAVVPTTTFYAPAPAPVVTTVASPVTTFYAPAVVSGPVVTTAPVVTTTMRPVVVRSRVYVPGQPVRNVFRALTP